MGSGRANPAISANVKEPTSASLRPPTGHRVRGPDAAAERSMAFPYPPGLGHVGRARWEGSARRADGLHSSPSRLRTKAAAAAPLLVAQRFDPVELGSPVR